MDERDLAAAAGTIARVTVPGSGAGTACPRSSTQLTAQS